ncbi:hypothetical protein H112_06173 [Trichophyton rubrum D6]|uniref:Uncharacterized protein n=3 Tax=Trichophyton TaxID=5550 RepID=A0A080WR39_TRIRC|nr:uncharacterized protein TERG_11732 [Trichophyton rubrum CBS 118892]EZF13802.1 hypothetical protein H100_06187 [Trichophyton rubrum MR850]EZF39536.1 hypothetical protein H102_06155 [Trichophyton rubrum CBS 100081]EZF50360.1 hypothetical protein H103_06180 [Trichophyton rubrum CBS 288.86]EZF60692.1 hypothetical protein H104_06167 [Trichophyton rubrum CBS 289.86]EZF71527.1 hypothetical protein H105_06192 [Trichophyton soudanense CBS 452.61]EZF82019.1 hypothetical protein H110_06176 [Trichophy
MRCSQSTMVNPLSRPFDILNDTVQGAELMPLPWMPCTTAHFQPSRCLPHLELSLLVRNVLRNDSVYLLRLYCSPVPRSAGQISRGSHYHWYCSKQVKARLLAYVLLIYSTHLVLDCQGG